MHYDTIQYDIIGYKTMKTMTISAYLPWAHLVRMATYNALLKRGIDELY